MDTLEKFLSELSARPIPRAPEQNFFDIGGSGYLENPTSDLIALFMGAQPSAPRWLAKALLCCLEEKGQTHELNLVDIVWDDLIAEREICELDSTSDTRKRLDLVVTSDRFILGIENKVYASAATNPFDIYDQLLRNRADGKTVVRCILRATNRRDDLPKGCAWPVITYAELVEKAQGLYGCDVAFGPLTKWSYFYTEFLKHLKSLSTLEYSGKMSESDISFITSHFSELRKAKSLLEEFELDLRESGHAEVVRALASADVDVNVNTAVHSWPNGHRALRYRPQNWGGESDVVLVFFDNSDSYPDEQIGYYLRAYIRKGSEKVQLSVIEQKLIDVTKSKQASWINEEDESFCWYEGRGGWLAFGAYAADYTRDGSVKALGDLAVWLQKNAFQAEQ